MLNIPEGLPILSAGAHPSPETGACFMEFNALLAGLEFNDRPKVVDGGLATALQLCNDAMSDEGRIRLVPLLGRALGLVAPGFELTRQPFQSEADYARSFNVHNLAARVLRSTAREVFAKKAFDAWGVVVDPENTLKVQVMQACDQRVRQASPESPGFTPGFLSETCSCSACRKQVRNERGMRIEVLAQIATWLHEAYEEAMAFHGWERQAVTEVPVGEILPRVTPAVYATTIN